MTGRARIAAAALLAAAAAVRLFRLDHFSYGLDEVLQAYWIQGDWTFFWKSLKFDAVHPPLDYLIGRFLEFLDPADWARKLPAVAWGVGTVWALGLLLARRAGNAAGWIAALLLAFAPFHVRYSQELRPYSLGLFFLVISLLALDRYLAKPGPLRLATLWLACLATAYTLYVATIVLAIAATAMLLEDVFSRDDARRRAARKFLAWSPAFAATLFIAYLPWWPVVLEAARRPPPVPAPPMAWDRLTRLLSFFAFAPDDGQPLGRKGPFYLLLVLAGLVIAWRRPKLRFLVVWPVVGFLAIEILGHLHPHWYVSRRFLPAGLAFPALAAVALAALASRRGLRTVAAAVVALVLVFDLRSLAVYFREGRADWRTLADYLRRTASSTERVFTENQYSQLCVAFYLVGPEWLYEGGKRGREVLNLDGEVVRLTWSWKPGERAWLVLAGEPRYPDLHRWASIFPSLLFPKAEGSDLRRLEPALRDRAFAPGR
ncbi:MAG: glycosyltransferase family 39 protein [Acidobacteriota bacterium]|nr:glycosyltransferase family 39 protein [Acidobacteriota bacterium]MDQ5871217.1 glycosyltransferase family 39 protein [Acidobacteriota bacterium]